MSFSYNLQSHRTVRTLHVAGLRTKTGPVALLAPTSDVCHIFTLYLPAHLLLYLYGCKFNPRVIVNGGKGWKTGEMTVNLTISCFTCSWVPCWNRRPSLWEPVVYVCVINTLKSSMCLCCNRRITVPPSTAAYGCQTNTNRIWLQGGIHSIEHRRRRHIPSSTKCKSDFFIGHQIIFA